MAVGSILKNLVQLFVCLGATGGAANAASGDNVSLSVMTYNVKGLPWPFAKNRSEAFAKMETRLLALRQKNAQPHVIVLQEAFITEAKQIAGNSGYRFIANGPSKYLSSTIRPTLKDIGFASAASFFKGEKSGKVLDSGLQIASDYPILSVKRAAFPAFACAGYDCLANKGILLVTISVPGSATPITIATTHLNSKRGSGVSLARSLHAYQRQISAITSFLDANRDPDLPIIFAGDFNASTVERRSYLAKESVSNWSRLTLHSALQNCIADASLRGRKLDTLANYIAKRGRDWQFYTSGVVATVGAVKLQIPFGRERDGTMLSDHVGFGIVYSVQHNLLGSRKGSEHMTAHFAGDPLVTRKLAVVGVRASELRQGLTAIR